MSPRAKKPDIEPGSVPLEDEPKPAPGGKKIGSKAKGGRPRKEEEPRSHHKRPGPDASQVKGALQSIGGLAQGIAHRVLVDKETGRSRLDGLLLSDTELASLANAVGNELLARPRAARLLATVGNVSKVSPLAKLAAELAAPRLARRGMIPPPIASMLGASEEDIRAGLVYREERMRRDRTRSPGQPDTMRARAPVDARDRVPVSEDRNTGEGGLPSVGVPPEAYEPVRASSIEPRSSRGGGGMDSLTEPPR